jgi:hypothetical protein
VREVKEVEKVENLTQKEGIKFEYMSELFGGPEYTCTGEMDLDA